ncbi:palmitoyl-protein thioesterase ABHD10, mitochondrial-like isoform X2 [Amphiura filiformis]|uniref:palmitoyl-protein thioesterase ABHD10, mitochondrial-like isoform X2 n=1 Tax=Amphiura filiformis TaxID=82378 RepID=UPI003B2131AC
MLIQKWMASTYQLLPRSVAVAVQLKTRTTFTMSGAGQLQYLDRPGGHKISYRKTEGLKSPGVIFLPGFMSNMNGGKALAVERYSQHHGHSYVRFDYQGCGESIGDPELAAGTRAFDVWKMDAQAVLDQLTSGPQILVGSSMGGAIMLLLAIENPTRVQALLGVSTAVTFDKPLTYTEDNVSTQASTTNEYVTPKDFWDKKYQRCLMSDSIPVTQPVCLIHGMQDDTISYMTSVDLSKRLQSKHVDVVLRKEGQHRMSKRDDLALLGFHCCVRSVIWL